MIENMSTDSLKMKIIFRVIADVGCIACVAIPVIILYVSTNAYRRGFFCDDESLMHPHLSNTIPTWVAGFVGIVLPTLSIVIIESIMSYKGKTGRSHLFAACYKMLMPFYFGVALTQLTTDIAKYSIGRLRPHFLTVCKPNITLCTTAKDFITDSNICLGTDTAAIEEARLSFPSGHSSMAFYCMLWLMVYLQYKFTWKRYWLIRPVLQAIAFFLAYYCALSRISDYMHHWSDVLGGAVIGIVLAVLDIFLMSNLLPWRNKRCSECQNTLPMFHHVATDETIISH